MTTPFEEQNTVGQEVRAPKNVAKAGGADTLHRCYNRAGRERSVA
jgi:hypothetical protein